MTKRVSTIIFPIIIIYIYIIYICYYYNICMHKQGFRLTTHTKDMYRAIIVQ